MAMNTPVQLPTSVKDAITEAAIDVLRTQVPDTIQVQEVLAPEVVEKVEAIVRDDPIARNDLNQEPLVQSRILNYSTLAAVATMIPLVVTLFNGLGWNITIPSTEDVMKVGGSIITLYAVFMVFRARIVSGLKPMWSRLLGPGSG